MSSSKMREMIEKRAVPEDVLEKAARGALELPPAESLEVLIHLSHDAVFSAQAKQTLHKWSAAAIVAAIADPSAPKEILQWAVSPENPKAGQILFGLAKRSGDGKSVDKLLSVCPAPAIADLLTMEEVRTSEPMLQKLLTNPNLKPDYAALVKMRIEQLHGGAKPAAVKAPVPPAVPALVASEAVKAEPVKAPEAQSATHTDKAVTPAAAHEAAAMKKENAPVHKKESADEPDEKEVEEQSSAWLQQHAAEIAAEDNTDFSLLGGLLGDSDSEDAQKIDLAKLEESVLKGIIPKERISTVQKLTRMPVSLRIQQALKGTREERTILIRDNSRLVCLAVLASPKLAGTEVENFASLKSIREEALREMVRNRKFRKNYVVVKNLCNNPRTPIDLTLGLLNDLQPYDLRTVAMNKNVPETIRKIALKKFQDKVSGRR